MLQNGLEIGPPTFLAQAHRKHTRCTMRFAMTTPELCELAGFTRPELQRWIDAGLLEADRDGRRREFADDDLERARLIKALHTKGLPLSRLPRENLAFDGHQFVLFDGRELRGCRDAAEAVAAAAQTKRCALVDLRAVRAGLIR